MSTKQKKTENKIRIKKENREILVTEKAFKSVYQAFGYRKVEEK